MTSQQFAGLIFDVEDGGVATITLNRPKAMNSFDVQMIEDFAALWKTIRDDDRVRAIVLRAAPGRAFCTGMDVHGPSPVFSTPNVWNQTDPGERLGPKSQRCWKPVVTAVHGMCAGGAFYFLNESDLIICAEDATFFDPHVTYGMIAALEPIGLTHKIGLNEILRMALLGAEERIGAETALRIGLVTEITKLDTLWARAHELALSMANKPAMAIQGTVRAIWESLDMPRSAALRNALKYPQVGQSAKSEVDRSAVMGAATKTFRVR
jgi:enoyl-CoA hydratase/carnithine racemase